MSEEECKGCRFYRVDKVYGEDSDRGNCRRSPPALVQGHGSFWPAIGASGWCGEWEAKEREAPAWEGLLEGPPGVHQCRPCAKHGPPGDVDPGPWPNYGPPLGYPMGEGPRCWGVMCSKCGVHLRHGWGHECQEKP